MHVSCCSLVRALTPTLLMLVACGGAAEPAATPPESAPAAEGPAAPSGEPPAAAPAAEPTATEPAAPAPVPVAAADSPTPSHAPAAGPNAAKTPKTPGATPSEAATLAAAAVPTAPSASAAAIACGEDGQPRCPLQAFMEDEIDKPLESGDLEHVAAALMKVAKMAPDPAWNANGANGFRGMAEASAAAARANDVPALQQSCKSCHKAFRRQYKEKFRPRPLP